MNLILEHSDKIKYFTNMQHVFSALGNIYEDYDWYVSDLETNFYIPDVFNNSDKDSLGLYGD